MAVYVNKTKQEDGSSLTNVFKVKVKFKVVDKSTVEPSLNAMQVQVSDASERSGMPIIRSCHLVPQKCPPVLLLKRFQCWS